MTKIHKHELEILFKKLEEKNVVVTRFESSFNYRSPIRNNVTISWSIYPIGDDSDEYEICRQSPTISPSRFEILSFDVDAREEQPIKDILEEIVRSR